MLTVRLPEDLEKRLQNVAISEKRPKAHIIRAALEAYLLWHDTGKTAYELGEDLFGRHGSGQGDLSITYKSRLRETIGAKHAH